MSDNEELIAAAEHRVEAGLRPSDMYSADEQLIYKLSRALVMASKMRTEALEEAARLSEARGYSDRGESLGGLDGHGIARAIRDLAVFAKEQTS